MNETLIFNFSHRFPGIVWNTITAPDEPVLIIEDRDPVRKQVLFSALNFNTNTFLWRDKPLEETWWVNASAVTCGIILFTVYLDTNNPDKKGILAYSLQDMSLTWWNNDFSISSIKGDLIVGFTSKTGLKELILDVRTGKERTLQEDSGNAPALPIPLQKPLQYGEGMEYFETVKTFLGNQLNLTAVSALEYLETDRNIVISFYSEEGGLANYLLVISKEGEILLKEKLDWPVKGIGMDTFFILGNALFFVKNKVELVSYTIL